MPKFRVIIVENLQPECFTFATTPTYDIFLDKTTKTLYAIKKGPYIFSNKNSIVVNKNKKYK